LAASGAGLSGSMAVSPLMRRRACAASRGGGDAFGIKRALLAPPAERRRSKILVAAPPSTVTRRCARLPPPLARMVNELPRTCNVSASRESRGAAARVRVPAPRPRKGMSNHVNSRGGGAGSELRRKLLARAQELAHRRGFDFGVYDSCRPRRTVAAFLAEASDSRIIRANGASCPSRALRPQRASTSRPNERLRSASPGRTYSRRRTRKGDDRLHRRQTDPLLSPSSPRHCF